jgi:heat shock protein HslJ
MPDLKTDEGLRQALHEIAAWGRPSAVPDPDGLVAHTTPLSDRRPGVARPALAAACLLLVVGGVALAVAAQGDGPDEPSLEAVPADVVDVDWDIESVSVEGGTALAPPPDSKMTIRFNGSELTGETCNHFSLSATLGPGTVSFGDDRFHTLMACADERGDIERAVDRLTAGRGTWAINQGRLRLEANGVVLHARPAANPFPTEDLKVLAESPPGALPQWHFGYGPETTNEYFLTFEGREELGTPFASAGLSVDLATSLEAHWIELGSDRYAFGTLPQGAAAARLVADSGSTLDLEVFALPNGRMVFGDLVAVEAGTVEALDENGAVIATSRPLGD